jgi:enoyl-CoA hydratase/carnithine racemase
VTDATYPEFAELKVEHVNGGILRVVLNRAARKNSLTRELVRAFGETFAIAAADKNIRVIVLTGAGDSFCSGADLTTIQNPKAGEIEERIDEFHRMIWGIVNAPQPVVAALPGAAVGFGADLALACDMRLFSSDAYLEEGFIKVGLMPDGGGTHWMSRFAGPRAFEMLALGQRLSADDCLSMGIANRVLDAAELESATLSLALRLAKAAPLSLREIKSSLREGDRQSLAAALSREKKGQARLIFSADFAEGVNAFLAKRAPVFTGK